ncbi:MAG: hypothetical protein U1E05_00500, partial [Patescibacteria group bacterium]|nr:hypothetical protein [Patescibacteria group bacterium]
MVLSWPCDLRTKRRQFSLGNARVWQAAIAGIAAACLANAASAAPVTDVSSAELAGFTRLYQLPIPSSFNFNSVSGIAGVPYSIDTTGDIVPGSFTRVAYYMELQSTAVGAPRYWVWASMDTPSTNPLMLGVPNAGTNIVYNGTIVTNLHVESNHPTITSGSFDDGNLEFWASNYGGNGGGALGSNDSHYDWRDGGGTTIAGHGSMQVFNYSLKQTLFGFNGLNQSGRMGIGNQNTPGTGDTDWTFGPGAGTFSIRNLEIWVNPPASETYTWDGLGDGEWTASRWGGSGYPNEGVNAVVQSNTVTVNGNQSARTLTVNSGGVAIGPGSSLAVAAINAISVEAGGLMTLDGGTTGASLIATNGGGSISSLVLNGLGTISNATQ